MKKFIFTISLASILLFISSSLYAHKEWVHTYVVKQAYELLKLHYPQFIHTELNSVIVDYNRGCSGWPWQYGTITAGAYREDCEDPIFHKRGVFSQRTTITHFWDADDINPYAKIVIDGLRGEYENAFQKIFYLEENL